MLYQLNIILLLFVLLSCVCLIFGCYPLESTGQSDYCHAKFVFEAEILDNKTGGVHNKFAVRISKVYKGRIGYKKVHILYGNGRLHSCGPHYLYKREKYIIFANFYDGRFVIPAIGGYITMKYVDRDDIERMTLFYDCSCEIKLRQPRSPPFVTMAPPTRDECRMPIGACTTNVFCKRNYNGICVPGIKGKC